MDINNSERQNSSPSPFVLPDCEAEYLNADRQCSFSYSERKRSLRATHHASRSEMLAPRAALAGRIGAHCLTTALRSLHFSLRVYTITNSAYLLQGHFTAFLRICPCYSCCIRHQIMSRDTFLDKPRVIVRKIPLDYPELNEYTEYCIQNTVFRAESQAFIASTE
jgi:hypothetical protein